MECSKCLSRAFRHPASRLRKLGTNLLIVLSCRFSHIVCKAIDLLQLSGVPKLCVQLIEFSSIAQHTIVYDHRRRSSVNFRGGGETVLPEKYVWRINTMPEFYMTLAGKLAKYPIFMIFARKKLQTCVDLYHIYLYTPCLKKTVQNYFCHNFVKFSPWKFLS